MLLGFHIFVFGICAMVGLAVKIADIDLFNTPFEQLLALDGMFKATIGLIVIGAFLCAIGV